METRRRSSSVERRKKPRLLRKKDPNDIPMHLSVGDVASKHDKDVVRVHDRRLNKDIFTQDPSTYALLRAWVRDDPHRPLLSSSNEEPRAISIDHSRYAAPIQQLTDQLHYKPATIDENDYNSLKGLQASEVLASHVAYFKKIRKLTRVVSALEYANYRVSQCRDPPLPPHPLMERLLLNHETEIRTLIDELRKKS